MMRRVLITSLLVLMAWFVAQPVAEAHALLKHSNPASNAQLNQAPPQIVLDFTEPPDTSLSVVQVLDSTGANVASGKAQPVSGKPTELRVPVGKLAQGTYTVSWRTVSKTDGHVTAGSFAFGVGEAASGATQPSSGSLVTATGRPSVLSVVGRWAFYWGVALLLAAGVTGLFMFDGRLGSARVLLAASLLAAAVGLAMMIVAERSAIGTSFSALARSPTGRPLIEQAAALVVTAVAVFLVGVRSRPWSLIFLAAAAAATMLFHAMGSHAAVSMAWFNVTIQWIHIVAVGIWVGGLVWLLVLARPRSAPSQDGSDRSNAVKRYSWVAGITLAVVAITGTIRAIDEVGGIGKVSRLLHDSFGVTLLVKLGLFLVLVALGARNRYVNVPAFADSDKHKRALARTVTAEIVLAAGILGATGLLSQLTPPVDTALAASQTAAHSQAVVVAGSDFATSVRVRLTASPGTVGSNTFTADVTDFDTGKPVDARRVSLRFSLPSHPDVGASSMDLKQKSPGVWSGQGSELSIEGTWAVTILVQKSSGAVEVPLKVATRTAPEPIQSQVTAGQPTVFTIALPNSLSVQTYVDPGKPGPDSVHFTFFKASGKEEPIMHASATATGPTGKAEPAKLIRFDKGHFVANLQLTSGTWKFEIKAMTDGGQSLNAFFSQDIAQ